MAACSLQTASTPDVDATYECMVMIYTPTDPTKDQTASMYLWQNLAAIPEFTSSKSLEKQLGTSSAVCKSSTTIAAVTPPEPTPSEENALTPDCSKFANLTFDADKTLLTSTTFTWAFNRAQTYADAAALSTATDTVNADYSNMTIVAYYSDSEVKYVHQGQYDLKNVTSSAVAMAVLGSSLALLSAF